jgi:transposase
MSAWAGIAHRVRKIPSETTYLFRSKFFSQPCQKNSRTRHFVALYPILLGWTIPRHHVPELVVETFQLEGPSIMEFKRISVDTSKSVFTLHGIDVQDRPILRRNLSRTQFEAFFSKLPATEVVLEACGGSHHWGRVLGAMGHSVRLIPPQYVKPFVKRGKNDRNDAEAINEAASRPSMRFVPVKSAEMQAQSMELSTRQLLLQQRTQLVNSLRGHAMEFGLVAGKGIEKVEALLEMIAHDPAMPSPAKQNLALLGAQIAHLDGQLKEIDRRLVAQHKASAVSSRLAEVPGIGPITALTLTLKIDPRQFESGRHFAAWLGLTPREKSTGGRQRMGGISRAGQERVRQLLVVGATAVIRHAKPGSKMATEWLLGLLERRPRKVAAVALANKMARIAWAMMTNETAYRRKPVAV